MKILFDKVTQDGLEVEISQNNVSMNGNIKKKNNSLSFFYGKIIGELDVICDRCGDPIKLDINEDVKLLLSSGSYKDIDNVLEDVVEFYDNYIDLDEILNSEIEAFKSDYFYCEKCNNL